MKIGIKIENYKDLYNKKLIEKVVNSGICHLEIQISDCNENSAII